MSDGSGPDWTRRALVKFGGGVAALRSIAGLQTAVRGGTRSQNDTDGDENEDGDESDAGVRLASAEFVSPNHFDSHNYERVHTHRKKQAIETLLSDPKVNDLARGWMASFESYEPLTNHVETVSLQGTSDLQIDRDGFDDPEDGATFTITATRQVAFGLVDRRSDELFALTVADSDTQWTEQQDEDDVRIGRHILNHPEVSEFVGEKNWFPLYKGATGSITGLGYGDLRHGEGGTAVLYVHDGKRNEVSIVSVFLDGSDPDNPEILHVHVLDRAVRNPPHEMVERIRPARDSVLGDVPGVPSGKRPFYTANDGHHRIEPPDETFAQNGWTIRWTPPDRQGITVKAEYQGSPVFEALNNPITFTGYYLPPREGRSTLDWYFPDRTSVFNGDLLFWDTHGPDAGGPGMLGKIDYPERKDTPPGFRLKTHYHTGAVPNTAVDFHSGFRYGPYNYDISYEFFEDGTVNSVWRRHGPGFVTMFDEKVRETFEYREGGPDPPVVQHYTAATAMDVTPGTTDGVAVQVFDGDEWTTPATEFYREGDTSTIVRFSNPDGTERIDIPLDRNKEIVVVTRNENQIGPGEIPANRLDDGVESSLYHPAQYVDGEEIQGERVIAWLLMEAPVDQMPHPAGITNFATVGELQLSGY